MKHSWNKIWFDIVTGDGFQGSWEVEPASGVAGFNLVALERAVSQARTDDRYRDAKLLFAETGDEVHIGVFIPPAQPADPPAHWKVFEPEFERNR